MTDLRQGISPAAHAVLDALEEMAGPHPRTASIAILEIMHARQQLNRAMRVDPEKNGTLRRESLILAGACIIRAIESMDEAGKTIMEEGAGNG